MGDWPIGYVIGMAVGIGIGISIGISIGKKQKPWSELTEQEKRIKIWIIVAGAVLVVAGAVVFFLRMS